MTHETQSQDSNTCKIQTLDSNNGMINSSNKLLSQMEYAFTINALLFKD